MSPETLVALRGSIAKWRAIVDGTGVDEGAENCPLCRIFARLTRCLPGCPVRDKTGKDGCHDTPYYKFVYAARSGRTAAAQAELDFLISLLPEGETP